MNQTVAELPLRSALPIGESFRQEYLAFYRCLPLRLDESSLQVAIAGDQCADTLADLREFYQAEQLNLIEVVESALQAAIQAAFARQSFAMEMVPGEDTDAEHGSTDVRSLANEPPVVKFVNLLIREAHAARASDIHLEAAHDGLRLRLRIDGVLTELPRPPRTLNAAIVSRIKLLAELDIAERRAPQDGRIRVRLEERELDLRISTIPTIHGESVVMRLLDRGGQAIGLDALGMAPDTLSVFCRLAEKPHGIVLVTGPTGSGKTTSLYAALGLRNAVEEKIITVEDPVEYHLAQVTQVPVRTKAGVGFAAALRSILRQDPDVLMVGEMRDRETAEIAVQAAMTGHLVFSTLHTNDAVSAITRLVDLGVEPYLIAAAVEGIVAQRLVRRICGECVERYRPDPGAVALVANRPIGDLTLNRGRGCTSCRGTGYRGRVGLYEQFVITDDIRDTLARGVDSQRLHRMAAEQGMRTLRHDGWSKVEAGVTTIEEVLRVT